MRRDGGTVFPALAKTGELFKMMSGVNMAHVPYPGGGQLTNLVGGRVQVVFSPLPGAIEQVSAGKLRALAVTSASRWGAMLDVPTLSEFVPGLRPQNTTAFSRRRAISTR
jgi:tripartite-type tricarboxylate transporter receptor subunit TctC